MLTRYTGARYRDSANPDLVAYVEADELHTLDYDAAMEFYALTAETLSDADMAYLGCVDRFFLFTCILGRHDGFHPWLYDRCREVELEPDGYLDLWAREHYKSTLITFCGSIQEILNDPEITIGVFGHTKGISAKFVAQVKREFESNPTLRRIYPDVCWLKPTSEAPVWSSSEFTVRRRSNPKEATMEAHGLVDGQPTSRHFALLLYDDVVTRESVTNPEQIKKTTEAWELSDNLGAGKRRKWMVGTRYHFGDTYGDIIARGIVTERRYPATDDGHPDGKPVLLSQEEWDKKKKTQLSTLAAQMLQNPLAGNQRMFDPTWFKAWEIRPSILNVYIMVDPSRGRNARSDRTAMPVIGIDNRGNKYLLDGFCHRMKLSERWDHMKFLHKKWSAMPGVDLLKVGYERFGQQSDDEYFAERMLAEKYHFAIEELAWPREGGNSKEHRVERLQPDVQYGSFHLPAVVYVAGTGDCHWKVDTDQQSMVYTPVGMGRDGKRSEVVTQSAIARRLKERGQEHLLASPIKRKDENGKAYDLTDELIKEMTFFPFAQHDDLIDAVSRIYDMEPMPASMVKEDPSFDPDATWHVGGWERVPEDV